MKASSLEVIQGDLWTEPSQPPKVKFSASDSVSNTAKHVEISEPPHPPKEKYSLTDAGKPTINSFKCFALSNFNGELNDQSNKKYKVHTDTDSDGKREICTDIKCKYNSNSFAKEVKIDPGSETNCIPLSLCKTDELPKETAWNQLCHSLRHMMVELCKPMDGSSCQLRTSVTRSFTL